MTKHTRLHVEALDDRCLPSFSPATSFPVGTNPQDVVTADFNNDGRLDLATANADSNSVSVLLGNGDGTFQSPLTSAAADGARSLAVGDFNRDGKLDLAMVNNFAISYIGDYNPDPSNGVSVMLGNGDGSFQAPRNVPLHQGSMTTSVAVGDFNADGTMDLAVGAEIDPYYPGDVYLNYGRASVLLSNGDGSFQPPTAAYVSSTSVDVVTVADLNGDTHPDLLAGSEIYDWSVDAVVGVVKVLLGDGQGNFAEQSSNWRFEHGPSMAAADVDGDGDADLVSANGTDVRVRLGNGAGGFESPVGGVGYPAGITPMDVLLSDFNRDGRLDIATANAVGGNVSVLRGNGNGTFGGPEQFATGAYTRAVAAGDFNGDGWLDLAAANGGANTVSVLLNDQSWSSPPPPSVSLGDATIKEGNTGTASAIFTVTLSSVAVANVTVHYATSNGTAFAGSDFVPVSGTVTIPAGQTSATVAVPVIGDRLPEPNENFSVNLTAATNAAIVDGQGVGAITDDEPRISINDVSKKEGNGKKTTLFVFTVTLSAAYDQPVTMSFQTVNGTATTSDNDYVARTGTLTFAPGETTKTITIEVKGDSKKEASETFYLDLFDLSSNALFTKSRGTGTILNDD